jgi:16S rRNA (adenine1518-N6/adenine1519-N6)-dimethyltransferase
VLTPKKSLGQHWLKDSGVIAKIVAACQPASGVLEIGPGTGVLTRPLAAAAQVLAIEIDPRAAEELSGTLPKAQILTGDVLQADLPALLETLPEPRTLVSNLPYYITAAVAEKVCEAAQHLDRAVLMMQAEVAERLMAKPGDSARGSLSVFVQYFFEVESVCKVPPSAFYPPPKVDSRVLLFAPRQGRGPNEALFRLVRAGFKQPRKTLANNLSGLAGGKEAAVDWLSIAGISPAARPHQLTEEDWLRLAAPGRIPKS